MPIITNENGVLYELDTVTANENGTLYELDTVHSNKGGVLYEVHNALPLSLSWVPHDDWNVNVTYSGLDVDISLASGKQYLGTGNNSYITSNSFRLTKSTHIEVLLKYSGSILSNSENAGFWIFSVLSHSSIKSQFAKGATTQSFTFEFDLDPGKYYFRIGTMFYALTELSASITFA